MNFKEYFDKQAIVELGLKKYFPKPSRFENIAYEAMHYSLFSGGKRFRSILLLMVFEVFKKDFKVALPSSCAVEFVHTYSLIHDDLPSIDNDSLRRGAPTCHVRFGDAVALLAGDAFYAEAFNLIAKRQKAKSDVLVDVIQVLAEATGASGMVGGQVVDVCMNGRKNVSADELLYIHSNKTGKLIRASAKIGAMLAGANETQIDCIENYALNLGVAFQIVDDILDEVGETGVIGKEAGSDRKHRKVTYPSVFGIEEAKQKAIYSSEAAVKCLKGIESEDLRKLARFVVNRNN